jgi:hypothetical protein
LMELMVCGGGCDTWGLVTRSFPLKTCNIPYFLFVQVFCDCCSPVTENIILYLFYEMYYILNNLSCFLVDCSSAELVCESTEFCEVSRWLTL